MTADAVGNHRQPKAVFGLPSILIVNTNQAAVAQAPHLESARGDAHHAPIFSRICR
jgi:hypothetical protein